MAKILKMLKEHWDFDENVKERQVNADADKNWTTLTAYFEEVAKERRRKNQFSKKTAGTSQFNSANNIVDFEEWMDKKIRVMQAAKTTQIQSDWRMKNVLAWRKGLRKGGIVLMFSRI